MTNLDYPLIAYLGPGIHLRRERAWCPGRGGVSVRASSVTPHADLQRYRLSPRRPGMFRRGAGRPVLPRMDLAAQRRRTMSRCQRTIVSEVTSSLSPCGALSVSRRAGSLAEPDPPSSASGGAAAVAAGRQTDGAASRSPLFPRLLTPRQPQPRSGPRDQEEDEPQAHDR